MQDPVSTHRIRKIIHDNSSLFYPIFKKKNDMVKFYLVGTCDCPPLLLDFYLIFLDIKCPLTFTVEEKDLLCVVKTNFPSIIKESTRSFKIIPVL